MTDEWKIESEIKQIEEKTYSIMKILTHESEEYFACEATLVGCDICRQQIKEGSPTYKYTLSSLNRRLKTLQKLEKEM